MHYVKLINATGMNRGFALKEGLNVDDKPFVEDGDCVAGGLYFCDARDAFYWKDLGYALMATVTIPDGARVVKLRDNKCRADKIILGPFARFEEHPIWSDPALCLGAVQRNGHALMHVK